MVKKKTGNNWAWAYICILQMKWNSKWEMKNFGMRETKGWIVYILRFVRIIHIRVVRANVHSHLYLFILHFVFTTFKCVCLCVQRKKVLQSIKKRVFLKFWDTNWSNRAKTRWHNFFVFCLKDEMSFSVKILLFMQFCYESYHIFRSCFSKKIPMTFSRK